MWLRACEWGFDSALEIGVGKQGLFHQVYFFSALDVRVSVEPTVGGCGAGVYNYDLEI